MNVFAMIIAIVFILCITALVVVATYWIVAMVLDNVKSRRERKTTYQDYPPYTSAY